ncbi:thioredoxin family protein [Candidatus Bipolaricaulota bacterium]|nr:thioredoxin family protein [Candidatus Bipolaricaulota bacterium]
MRRAKLRQEIWVHGLSLVFFMVAFSSLPAFGQTPILEFSFETEPLAIPQADFASAWLRVTNSSVYEADDIEIALLSGPVELSPIEPIEVLDPFSDMLLEVPLSLGEDGAEGEGEALFELAYTYCIDDVCFQLIEEISLKIEMTPAVVEPTNGQIPDPVQILPAKERNAWELVFPMAVGLALIAALIAGRTFGRRWWVLVLLLVVLVAGLGYGMLLKQDQQAQSIGAVLCTSCVGIERAPREDPELSSEARTRIAAISQEVELLFFTATWCQACPYAKAMVQQVIEINPRISYRSIDVDEDRDAAKHYGIVQSGRTIVPAILRVDTGEVVFGIEALEERLIALLEESP